jgi:hypothetical protein
MALGGRAAEGIRRKMAGKRREKTRPTCRTATFTFIDGPGSFPAF